VLKDVLAGWSCGVFALRGSLRAVSPGAGRLSLLAVGLVVRRLCVGRFPEGRVPRRRKVVLAGCQAGRAAPLRWEVPGGACPEAQEGCPFFCVLVLFVCLFVGIKPEKLYSVSYWEGSKPPGSGHTRSGHTRAEAHTATCIPKTEARQSESTYLSIHG
jgi:hypothetical protein